MNAKRPGFFDVIKSVLASFIGVQSEKTRERDFTHGKAWHFIIIGLILTVLFILALWGVVKLVLSVAGAVE